MLNVPAFIDAPYFLLILENPVSILLLMKGKSRNPMISLIFSGSIPREGDPVLSILLSVKPDSSPKKIFQIVQGNNNL